MGPLQKIGPLKKSSFVGKANNYGLKQKQGLFFKPYPSMDKAHSLQALLHGRKKSYAPLPEG